VFFCFVCCSLHLSLCCFFPCKMARNSCMYNTENLLDILKLYRVCMCVCVFVFQLIDSIAKTFIGTNAYMAVRIHFLEIFVYSFMIKCVYLFLYLLKFSLYRCILYCTAQVLNQYILADWHFLKGDVLFNCGCDSIFRMKNVQKWQNLAAWKDKRNCECLTRRDEVFWPVIGKNCHILDSSLTGVV